MWFGVVSTLIDNDHVLHHSGQNLLWTHSAHNILTTGKHPKFFSSSENNKSHPVDLLLYQKNLSFTYRKFYWITFSQTFLFEVAVWIMQARKKSRKVTEQNFEIKTNVSYSFYFRFVRFYSAFPLPVFWRQKFGRHFDLLNWRVHLNYGAGGSRARTWIKSLSSLLKMKDFAFVLLWWQLSLGKEWKLTFDP